MKATHLIKKTLGVEEPAQTLTIEFESPDEANDLFHALYGAASGEPLSSDETAMFGKIANLLSD